MSVHRCHSIWSDTLLFESQYQQQERPFFAVICKLNRLPWLLTRSVPGYIATFEPSNIDTDDKDLVDIVYIQQKCVYMEFSDVKEVTFVSPLPNLIEAD